MSNLVPIWTPQDAVETAERFARELDRAERGLYISPRLMSVSRERKARRMDAAAVTLLMLVCAALGVLAVLAGVPR